MGKLCPRGKAAAKRKFKVYPSAYANAYGVKLVGRVGYPHSNVRIDTGVNIEDGTTYKRVLLDQGATRVRGPRGNYKGKV